MFGKKINIAVTGGVGCGKSTVLKWFADNGFAVVSADAVCHDALDRPEILDALTKRWGQACVVENFNGGKADRKWIAGRVFKNPAELDFLTGVLYPVVKKRLADFCAGKCDGGAAAGKKFRAAEVPLLFESGMETMFDYTVCVWAPECRSAGLADRSALQLPVGRKLELSDFALINNDGLDQLYRQCAALADQIDNMVV